MEFWFQRKAELKGQTNLKLCCLELFFFQKNGKQLVLCEDWKEIKYESTIKKKKKIFHANNSFHAFGQNP